MDRDNQQATPTEAEIAWLAGIIEGEGTLMMGLWAREGDRKPKIGLQIKVYNSDAGIIQQVVSLINRIPGVSYHVKEREQVPMLRPGKGGHYVSPDPMLTVSVSRLSAVYALLQLIRPWLFGDKGTRADLMVRFLERRFEKFETKSMGKRAPYDSGDLRLVLQFAKNGRRSDIERIERVLNELEQSTAKQR